MESLLTECEYLITFTGKLQVLATYHPSGKLHSELITEDLEEAKQFVKDNYRIEDVDISVTDW